MEFVTRRAFAPSTFWWIIKEKVLICWIHLINGSSRSRAWEVKIHLAESKRVKPLVHFDLLLSSQVLWCLSLQSARLDEFVAQKHFAGTSLASSFGDLLQCRQEEKVFLHMICWCYQTMKLDLMWLQQERRRKVKPIFPGWDFISFICFWLMRHKSGDSERDVRAAQSTAIYVGSVEKWVNLSHKKRTKQSIETFDKGTSCDNVQEETFEP